MERAAFTQQQRRLALALAAVVTVIALETMSVSTVLPLVKDDLGGLSLYGWVGAAFTLAQLVGIVVAGRWSDRVNPVLPLQVGMACFTVGLIAGSRAPTMLILVAARALQGLGAGMAPSVAYVCIGRAFDDARRPRMFAVLSTAWIVPSLVGPALAPIVATHFGWRWVFAGLVPFCIAGAIAAHKPVSSVGPPPVASTTTDAGVIPAVILAIGAALLLSGLGGPITWGLPLAAVGLVVAIIPFRRLTPPGTLRAASPMAAACASRGLLTFAFFGADYFIAFALVEIRGQSTMFSGFVLAAGAFTWTGGSWTQERMIGRLGPRRLVTWGLCFVAAGYSVLALVLISSIPVTVAFAGTMIAGLGIGLAYSPLSQAVLFDAPPDAIGAVTAGMQLCDTLGVSLGIGIAGVIVAAADHRNDGTRIGVGVAWGMCIVVALLATLPTRRVHGPPELLDRVSETASV